MISFEEFKAEYKELLDLQFAVAGAVAPNTYTMTVEFENGEDSQGGKHKRDLDVHNSFATDFPTTFNLYESNITFLISLRGEQEGEILNRLTITTSEILLEKEFTLCRDLKINGLYLYARFLLPENTYPMYNLTISAQNLPLLTGLFGECDPFLRILKKNTNFGTYHMVYESEVHRNTSSPSFKPIKLSLQRLCGGDHYREIKVQIWDFSKRGGHHIVGEFKTNLNNLVLLNKNNTPIKLLSSDGTKNHGTALIKELSPMIGPSFISKIYQGLKINLLNAIDTTGITPETEDLTERLQFVTNFSKELVERIGFMLNETKLQFFGLNGKCCTDNLYTNYVMDIFPISGDTKKNSFHYKQIKGDFFNKVIKNFMYNTEGGPVLNASNFIRFSVDHCEETRTVTPFCYTIVVVYLWTIPADLNKMLTEFVSIKDKPIMFWIVYLGQQDMELIQTLDGRKGFIIDQTRTIGPTCKNMSICASYKTEPHIAVRKLLIDTAQVFAYFLDK